MGLEIASTIGLFAFQAGASVAVVNAVTFGLASFGGLALSAATFGVQTYLQSQSLGGLAALNNENTGIQQQIRQAIPAQRLLLGRTTTSGALFFGKYDPPYTWYGLLLAAHEVDGLEKLIINNTEVFLDASGYATSTPYRDGSNIYLEASFRSGGIDQAIDPIIARDFPTMPTTFRQRGHATLVIKRTHGFGSTIEDKNEDYRRVWGDTSDFNPLVRLRGAKVHDPRRPDSVLADPSTWTWSDNGALCLARYLTHAWPDMTMINPTRLDWDQIAAAADECDAWEIDRNGTTFRRFTANGVVQSTDNPFDVIEALKLAMDGDLIIDRGKVYPVAGAKRDPEATFHIGMMIGGFEFQRERSTDSLVNVVKTRFVAPDRNYQTVEGPVLRDTDAIASDGAAYEATIAMPFVEDDPRAQRLAYYTKAKARAGRTLTVGATLEASSWPIAKSYRVDLPGTAFARVNGVYKLIGKAWNSDLRGYQLSFIEDTPERFDDAPAAEVDFALDADVQAAEAA